MTTRERRRAARIEIVQTIAGTTVPMKAHLKVKEMSVTGMLIETNAELSVRGIHEFRLFVPQGKETVVRGHIVHGRFVGKNGGVVYTLGIQFAFLPPESADVLRRFINETHPQPFPAPQA